MSKKEKNPFKTSKEQQLRELKEADTDMIKKMLSLMEQLLELDKKFIDPNMVSLLDKDLYEEDKEWLESSIKEYKNELRIRMN